MREQARRPAAERLTPRNPTAGPGRTPARWVRIERRQEGQRDSLWIFVGRGLYYELDSPKRLDIQRRGHTLILVPASGDAGYSLVAPAGHMPHFRADGARDLVDLEDGRYSAEVRGGLLEIGGRLD